MVDEKLDDSKAIRLELTVPCDARFRQVLAAMSEKMASYVGYATSEATEVAEILTRATDGVCRAEGGTAYTAFEVTFATSDETMEIQVRYICADAHPAGQGIEHLLSQGGDGDAPLALMQRSMHTVEFGHDQGVDFCTLTKLLPESE